MLKLKKTAIAVLAFGSSAVFAGTMGPVCSPGNVTVPCERTAWDFAGQALYFQPSVGIVGSNGWTTSTTPTGGTNYQMNNNEKTWGWGFKLEASYHFGTGNDLDLNWYHVGNSRSKTVAGPFVGISGSIYNPAQISVDPRWDMVNLELAQHVDFSQVSYARVHGGISWSRVANKSTIFSAAAGANPAAPASTGSTTYNGFGPRTGADLWYNFGNGLAFYADGATALYAGTQSVNRNATTTGGVTSGIGFSAMRVVPELEGKLGGTYTYSMAQGDLSLDVGWMWINYFNAIGQTTLLNFPPAENTDNFGLQGVYFGLKWVGNVV